DPFEELRVPRGAIELPLRVPIPPGFDAERLETWPVVEGRLEYVAGGLWFMPPCGDDQQDVAADLVAELGLWRRAHDDFIVGSNEAGMKLGDEVRAADAAVWRKADLGPRTGGLRRVAPVLAAEVAGRDDTVEMLQRKARWYLGHGVEVVWILVPKARSVLVVTNDGEVEHGPDDTIVAHPALPGLAPRVADLFRQLE
ncbi:MAG TPA: Uma2 family endonuclease, partial [Polyangiaceae bacterium]|nr:Uma2 family endonuclease [Polyangiaceae bacterium]